ncbi:hypothetical protein GIB67_013520 [Kingdonia uniflora]|uniref:Uncharacterized protein n=1 Tax=Kingdonia uniflora TaxID=39325 RepID=A0A7J7KUS9_9MAGN|nr:hypothetical protein GIB67_013520 [Kingdonia uniflora]
MGDSDDRLAKLKTKVSDLTTTLGELVEQLRLANFAKASASTKRRELTKKKGVAVEERDDANEEVDNDSSDAEFVEERSVNLNSIVDYYGPYGSRLTPFYELTISFDEDEGFDVQTAGYGLMATYHAKNEYCLLADMSQGFQVFVSIISQLEADK